MDQFRSAKRRLLRTLVLLRSDERATTAAEYAIIAAGISIVILGVIVQLGSTLSNLYYGEVTTGLK